MSGIFQKMKGGSDDPSSGGAGQEDADFADFAGAPQQPVASSPDAPPAAPGQAAPPVSSVPYTKWYRVWERTSPSDFKHEAFILPFIVFIVIFHIWGTRKNKHKVTSWAKAHIPILNREFAVVGYSGVPKAKAKEGSAEDFAADSDLEISDDLLKEQTAHEYTTYATGRQNVAFVDVTVKLLKRYNPMVILGESILGLFFDTIPPPMEKVEIVSYSFDGKEKEIVPTPAPEKEALEKKSKQNNSSYDGFVFAIVHKNCMRKLRQDRYDVSFTSTKDNQKLPEWVTVMSESAEITDTILTQELIRAVEDAGELFEYLVITDQPADKPNKIEEAVSRKRLILSTRLPSSTSTSAYTGSLPLFQLFLRLTDRLVNAGHFRQEVLRKLRHTREEEIKKLKKAGEEEKAEERKISAEKLKKEERDRMLRGMTAEEQRKFLEKESEREYKKSMKRQTRRA